jgi:hypothetical protein
VTARSFPFTKDIPDYPVGLAPIMQLTVTGRFETTQRDGRIVSC